MTSDNTDKKYESFKIPHCRDEHGSGSVKSLPETKNDAAISDSDGLFYEIEYDSYPIKGVGKFVLKPQKIEPLEKDEIRELFYSMRDIARRHQSSITDYSRFFNMKVHEDNAEIFYEQAMYMKDFEDDYPDRVPFSSYFPYYQMLGYEQLRTYFTWRTNVRKGVVNNTSLSYVFLYIYELLNNVGVDSPKDGLDRLLFIWTSFKNYDSSINKYIFRWLKDYHIYYNLPQTFKGFIEEHNLTGSYPKIADADDSFELFCSISKYDIKKSVFFTDETAKLITDCFYFVLEKIRKDFDTAGVCFDDAIFRPTKKLIPWRPFKDTLFYNRLKLPDKRIVISENEIYICSKNKWAFSTVITTEKGKQFIGYVMKQMESILRKVTKYKYKITANIDMVNPDTLNILKKFGLFIENIVENAVIEFYRESTKTVVEVNRISLDRIRLEALVTQVSLTVEEPELFTDSAPAPVTLPLQSEDIFSDSLNAGSTSLPDSWDNLRNALKENEINALAVIFKGDSIKEFADNSKIMLEVLADGINEKAMDYIGDNILDESINIYEDYEQQVKGMIEQL